MTEYTSTYFLGDISMGVAVQAHSGTRFSFGKSLFMPAPNWYRLNGISATLKPAPI